MSSDSIQTICVFCASSTRVAPHYFEEARQAGGLIARAGKHLVYGGGRNGLMGAVADGALEEGGTVTGIMPDFLVQRESLHDGLTQNHIVKTMHERQYMMQDLSDAFLVLPGGIGTLAELFEVVTWRQLGHHNKPVVILNSDGYWTKIAEFLELSESLKFLHPTPEPLWHVVDNIGDMKSILGLR